MDGLLNHLARGYIVMSEPVSAPTAAPTQVPCTAPATEEVTVLMDSGEKSDAVAKIAAVADVQQLGTSTATASCALDAAC
eukprot:2612288-Pleurochrysis_carterae.AAC.1